MNIEKRLMRLKRVEAVIGRVGDLSWKEVAPARKRTSEFIMAKLHSFLDGTKLPVQDPEVASRDREILRRWDRQLGIDYTKGPDPRVVLGQKLDALRARMIRSGTITPEEAKTGLRREPKRQRHGRV